MVVLYRLPVTSNNSLLKLSDTLNNHLNIRKQVNKNNFTYSFLLVKYNLMLKVLIIIICLNIYYQIIF